MGHDAHGGSQNNVAELAGGEEVDDPLLDLVLGNIESGADNAALVEASRELNYDLAGPVIVDDLEFSDVSCCHLSDRRVEEREGKQKVREHTCSVLEWYVASVKAVPLHGRPVDWCGRARECKSYACCFSGAKLFRRGAKHAPGHRSTSTIRENGSGAKCDARSYDAAEATKYPHFRPVAFGAGRTVRFFRQERYRKYFEVGQRREKIPLPPPLPVYANFVRFQSQT